LSRFSKFKSYLFYILKKLSKFKGTMVAKIRQSVNDSHNSTKPVVGEIDTNSPIQSVKDAVSLFGEVASSAENPTIKKSKSKPYSVEVI
jgi:hypothetical protein